MLDLASSTTVLHLTALAKSEIGRILATLIVFWLSAASIGFLQRRAVTRCLDEQEFARRRGNFVLVKNLILAGAIVALSIIWASKIAGVALSVAAVTGCWQYEGGGAFHSNSGILKLDGSLVQGSTYLDPRIRISRERG